MEKEARIPGLGLTTTELKSIDSYRKKKNTAVLSIMFTDIQGFTSLTEEKGESYMHELHSEHDRIVVDCIEKGRAGIVIKYIGDAVMAIFSEPTASVERALLIQRRLHEFNLEHPELDDLKVRIGLHMGQTVIENKMHIDLFGRHVNKASRMEGLAEGGQIYISYTVFDSVKSWLIEAKNAGFKHHGPYYLKGIRKPEDVYEVYNSDITQPKPAKKGRKSGNRAIMALVAAAAVFLMMLVAGTILLVKGLPPRPERQDPQVAVLPVESVANDPVLQEETGKTASTAPAEKKAKPVKSEAVGEVVFVDLYAEEPILDLKTRLIVTDVEGSRELKKAVTDLGAGHHIIHFVVSDMVWYYTEFEVKPGNNLIPLEFSRTELPDAQINLYLKDTEIGEESRTVERKYCLLEENGLKRTEVTGVVKLDVSGEKTSVDLTRFTIDYVLTIDGREEAAVTLFVDSPMGQEELIRQEPVTIWEDSHHKYTLSYHYRNESIQVNIDASFKNA